MVSKQKISIVMSLALIFMIILHFSSTNGLSQEPSETNKISEGNKILFARNNGYFSPSAAYSQMAAFFSAEGYVVEEIQSEINDSVLEGVSILFVNTYQVIPNTFNQSEIMAIESFVHSGGGLIMSTVGGGLDFGVKLASNLGIINSHTLDIHPSPVSENLPFPFINTSSGVFEIILSGTSKAAITTDVASFLPNIPIVAVNSYGEGKILACAVATIWDNNYWNVGGNNDLIKNYLQWFETEGVKKVLFARNNGYFSPSNAYSQMAALFDTHGYFIEEVATEMNETILAGTSILFVNTYQVSAFSQIEIGAIESFVYSGGGLIISSVGGGLDFGVKTSSNLGLISSHTLEMYPNPVTANIPSPIIATNSGIYDLILNGTAQAVVTTDASSTLPNETIIATNVYGEGKIMVSTVGTVWVDSYWFDGGNNDLIENYLRWVEMDDIKNFVFAKNNGYFSPVDAYGELANYLAGFGYIITELIDQDPTEELLSTTDIMLINSYQVLSGYSAESEAAIEEWVTNGGSLIIVARGISIDFGLHLYSFGQTDLLFDNDSYHIHYHPVTAGVTDIVVEHHSAVSKFDVGETATVVVSTTADSNSPERPIIAVNNYANGRVMGCAVSTIWDENFRFNQNKDLIRNFIDWSTTNTTTPIPWISSPNDVTFDEGSTGNNVTWTMGSYYPYYYQIFLDDILYQSGTWSSYPLLVVIDGLPAGTYTFSIHIYDHYGRTATDSVDVIVNEVVVTETAITTTTITGPETTSSETTSEATPYSFLAMIAGLVIFSSTVFYKRRNR